jgi:hypothetical protein
MRPEFPRFENRGGFGGLFRPVLENPHFSRTKLARNGPPIFAEKIRVNLLSLCAQELCAALCAGWTG